MGNLGRFGHNSQLSGDIWRFEISYEVQLADDNFSTHSFTIFRVDMYCCTFAKNCNGKAAFLAWFKKFPGYGKTGWSDVSDINFCTSDEILVRLDRSPWRRLYI